MLVCFLYLFAGGDCQHSLEQGLIDVSMATGLLSAVSVLPVGCLISLLFRLGQVSVHTMTVRHLSITTNLMRFSY